MQKFLEGKKTYIVAAGIVIAALVSFLTGEMDLSTAVVAALAGLGIGTLRSGVKAEVKPVADAVGVPEEPK